MARTAVPFSEVGDLSFLTDAFIREYSARAGLDGSTINEIIQLKNRLAKHEAVVRRLRELHELLYVQELPLSMVLPENPHLGTVLGDALRGVFYYLLILSGMPLMFRRYRERSWPDALRDEMIHDLATWVNHHHRNFGSPGLAWMVIPWFQSHINLRLVGFGRLQFNTKNFPGGSRVFRRKADGTILALYAGNSRFTSSGLLDDLQEEASPDSWFSRWRETGNSLTGNPVYPDGLVKNNQIELAKSEWDNALSPGDPILNIHIPERGPLTPEACRDSLRRARDFFARQLPDYHWKAFFCDSWLLDPQLAEILPENSNIRKFQRNCYLIPYPGEADTVFRCFGVKGARDGIDSVPHTTSLQRALAQFAARGRRFHYGGMFLLREDMEKEQPYRTDGTVI